MKKEFTGDSDRIVHIYDRMFKKILTLSARAVIGLINGLFGTEYPPDSTITYNWTEHHDEHLATSFKEDAGRYDCYSQFFSFVPYGSADV